MDNDSSLVADFERSNCMFSENEMSYLYPFASASVIARPASSRVLNSRSAVSASVSVIAPAASASSSVCLMLPIVSASIP